jgi:hypothetical protein
VRVLWNGFVEGVLCVSLPCLHCVCVAAKAVQWGGWLDAGSIRSVCGALFLGRSRVFSDSSGGV